MLEFFHDVDFELCFFGLEGINFNFFVGEPLALFVSYQVDFAVRAFPNDFLFFFVVLHMVELRLLIRSNYSILTY